jgi:HD-GYP domain-containing protein (c-di-GMP phosphodiesterase class II)
MFAPLHDVGKLAIPDRILLKPGKLSPEEFEVMKTHTLRGRQLVDELIDGFGLDGMEGIDMLRNIAAFHHEALNGTGYPLGLKAEEIPVEARIIAVADVFDALTSRRPYKEAISNEEAFAMLAQMSGTKLDPECIHALAKHKEHILQIQLRFSEDIYG